MPAPTPTQAPVPLPPSEPENKQFAHYLAKSLVPIRKDACSYLAATQSSDEYGRMCYGMAMTAFGLIELCVSIDFAMRNDNRKIFVPQIAEYVSKCLHRRGANAAVTSQGAQEVADLDTIVKALWLTQRHKIAHTATAHYGQLENIKVDGPILEGKNGSFIFHTFPFLLLAIQIADWQIAEIRAAPWPGKSFADWSQEQQVDTANHMPLDLLMDPMLQEKLSPPLQTSVNTVRIQP